MTEFPTQPSDSRGDPDDVEAKEQMRIAKSFEAAVEYAVEARGKCIGSELKRHGFNPNSLDDTNQTTHQQLKDFYISAESSILQQLLDSMTEVYEIIAPATAVEGAQFSWDKTKTFEIFGTYTTADGKELVRMNKYLITPEGIKKVVEELDKDQMQVGDDEFDRMVEQKEAETELETKLGINGQRISLVEARKLADVIDRAQDLLAHVYSSALAEGLDFGPWQNPSDS